MSINKKESERMSGKRSFKWLCIVLIILASACNSTNSGQEPEEEFVVFEVELAAGEEYQYDLGLFGDEEYAEILRPPEFAMRSELEHSPASGRIIYGYKPNEGYAGEDYVIIESRRGSDGESRNQQITITIIRFTIYAE